MQEGERCKRETGANGRELQEGNCVNFWVRGLASKFPSVYTCAKIMYMKTVRLLAKSNVRNLKCLDIYHRKTENSYQKLDIGTFLLSESCSYINVYLQFDSYIDTGS